MMLAMKSALIVLSLSAAFSNALHLRQAALPCESAYGIRKSGLREAEQCVNECRACTEDACQRFVKECQILSAKYLLKQWWSQDNELQSQSAYIGPDAWASNAFDWLTLYHGGNMDTLMPDLKINVTHGLVRELKKVFPKLTDGTIHSLNIPRVLNEKNWVLQDAMKQVMKLESNNASFCTHMHHTNHRKEYKIFADDALQVNLQKNVVVDIVKCAILGSFQPQQTPSNVDLFKNAWSELFNQGKDAAAQFVQIQKHCNRNSVLYSTAATKKCTKDDAKRTGQKDAVREYLEKTQTLGELLPSEIADYDEQRREQMKEVDRILRNQGRTAWSEIRTQYDFGGSCDTREDQADECYVLAVAAEQWTVMRGTVWAREYNGQIHGLWYQNQNAVPRHGYQMKRNDAAIILNKYGNRWAGSNHGYVRRSPRDERINLMMHEWKTHGNKSNFDFDAYWQNARYLLDMVNRVPYAWRISQTHQTKYCFKIDAGTWKPVKCTSKSNGTQKD
jgi:hypothetical protein